METYRDLLNDPRWKMKARRVIKFWGGGCERCDNTERPLHVHHKYYLKGVLPWDYPAGAYEVLCDSCHRVHHGIQKDESEGSQPVKHIATVMAEYVQKVSKEGERKNG